MTDRLIIFDTTLRDGEQAPGASLTVPQKLEIARHLARLKVDVIEGGFPFASPGDFQAVSQIAREVKGPRICGLARALRKDIESCWQAVRHSARPRIHTFLATSPVHMKYKLRMSPNEVLASAVAAVKLARKLSPDVEFSPEDAARSDVDFLCRVVEAVIAAGARTVNIPDTVGYAIPEEFGDLIRTLRERVPNSDKAVFSVHCHNDLGLATANSLAAVRAGARQVECTINGIGERAGNASLEEVVMSLRTRREFFGLTTGVRTEEITKASALVSRLTGLVVQPNKAIVGANAFTHESGIHQHGVMVKSGTYEIMRPEWIGLRASHLRLGKLSGRHAFVKRLKDLGVSLLPKRLESAFARFKSLADKKKEIFDEDLLAIAEDEAAEVPETYRLEYITVTSGNMTIPTATVRLRRVLRTRSRATQKVLSRVGAGLAPARLLQEAACGDGPVDAAYQAIDRITGMKGKLLDYALRAVSGGKDALGEVTVRVQYKGQIVHGKGASTDIIEASARAYVNAINRLLVKSPT